MKFSFVAVAIAIGAATMCWSTAMAADERSVLNFQTMHQQPWFLTVMGASVVGWVLGMTKGFSSSAQWLIAYWPNRPQAIVFVMDLMIFVGVGGYIGTGIFQPTNFVAALAAGVSWPLALGALSTKMPE